MAIGAGNALASEASRIDGVTIDGETRGKKAQLLLFTQPSIAQQVGMLRHPQCLMGRENVPTMRAGYPSLQAESSALKLDRHGKVISPR